MSNLFFDVIVIGSDLGSLLTATLLAKRRFRVAWVPYHALTREDRVDDFVMPRLIERQVSHSPLTSRIFKELSVPLSFARHKPTKDVSPQIVAPGHRFLLPCERDAWCEELGREFPASRQSTADFYDRMRAIGQTWERLMDLKVPLPPDGLKSKYLSQRALNRLGLEQLSQQSTLMGEGSTIFTQSLRAYLRFSDLLADAPLTDLRVSRLLQASLDVQTSPIQSTQQFYDMLLTLFTELNGNSFLGERVSTVHTLKKRIVGIELHVSGARLGCDAVACGMSFRELKRLIPSELWALSGSAEWEPQPSYFCYQTNWVVRDEGIPPGWSDAMVALIHAEKAPHGENALRIHTYPSGQDGTRVICVESFLRGISAEEALKQFAPGRQRILESLRQINPFIDRHLLLSDSPHDGKPPFDYVAQQELNAAEPWSRGPQFMPIVYHYPSLFWLNICALPAQLPLTNLTACGEQVMPALGVEGTLMAAWSAAERITRSNRTYRKLRQGSLTNLDMP